MEIDNVAGAATCHVAACGIGKLWQGSGVVQKWCAVLCCGAVVWCGGA